MLPDDVFSTGWQQKGLLASETLHQLINSSLNVLSFHSSYLSCLRRTWWDGVKESVWRGRKPANTAYETRVSYA